MKNILRKCICLAGSITALGLFAACDFFLGQSELSGGNVTIHIGSDSADARSAIPSSLLSQLEYVISSTGEGQTESQVLTGGRTSSTISLSPGAWIILVEAHLPPNQIYIGSGSKQITVTAGQSQSVNIDMVFMNTSLSAVTVNWGGTDYPALATANSYTVEVPSTLVPSFTATAVPMVADAEVTITGGDSAVSGDGQRTATKTGPFALGDAVNFPITVNAAAGYSENYTLTVMVGSFTLGAAGPGTGIIFYDKGYYSDGWRYLEAAPADASASLWAASIWVTHIGTSSAIGAGKANTETIRTATLIDSASAAYQCYTYSGGGKSDWYLPSKEELEQMYAYKTALGLSTTYLYSEYWSSTDIDANHAYAVDMRLTSGIGASYQKCLSFPPMKQVRPIRQF
ncbi:MAG: DUF1566 domain-containing protein [Treponema sp.]|jgi:hypothetical protein|nr:DUF1566 domain-containing protein [Treponema sp.]